MSLHINDNKQGQRFVQIRLDRKQEWWAINMQDDYSSQIHALSMKSVLSSKISAINKLCK